MWPFRTKQRTRDREKARDDKYSLGNLLLRTGMITPAQLIEALEYQDRNPERMLGEALVQMGVVDKDVVEALLAVQQLEDGKAPFKNLDRIVDLAKNRKKTLHEAHDRVVAAAMCLNGD